ncbi:hypothetical protein [Sinorhizobium meliloti]|uniref:hypothetical protein n=1 Tax=Rhizobium meliloti TaxID=382 RepID=UPI0001E4B078|nr:hypothetical protein [Sinorhizobium meliloti]AEG54046.1 hypothetical protein Sinme_2328 [Sinorhizobium meliloti AK83]MDE4590233.1 hypothetical protein [Sinorhizobium meliloti]SEI68987.1 hypothetical protein SAMN04244575_01564 [Sinorhizobium meliloti]
MVENNIYLTWSNEHRRWWGPGGHGYLKQIADAGRYNEAEGLEICTNAMLGRRGDRPLPETPVPLKLVDFAVGGLKPSNPAIIPSRCRKSLRIPGG